jgi:hypothetical protein
VGEPGNPQNLNRYSYVVNNPVNAVDPSGYFHRHKKKGGFFGTIFGGIFGFVFGGPVGAFAGASLGALSDFVPDAARVLQIMGGIMLMFNPQTFVAGLFMTVSGGLGFCESTECQMASGMTGIIGGMASISAAMSGSRGVFDLFPHYEVEIPFGKNPLVSGGIYSIGMGIQAAAAAGPKMSEVLRGHPQESIPAGMNPSSWV